MAVGIAGPLFSQTVFTNRRGSLMKRRSAFTLVEILIATAISLIMLGAVVAVFASVMQSINQARAVLETSDRLRSAAELLRSDLRGLTVIPVPPRDPANNEGYFEYTEGPVGQKGEVRPFGLAVVNLDDLDPAGNPYPDSTVADNDDMLMFTTRSSGQPFVGRCLVNGAPATVESDVAEVAWFVRGNRLYRRVRLVAPKVLTLCDLNGNGRLDPAEWVPSGDSGAVNFNRYYDIATHFDVNAGGWVFSTLGDLTKPENRYAHRIGDPTSPLSFPFHPHRLAGWQTLGLPTLAENASAGAVTTWLTKGILPPAPLTARAEPLHRSDYWNNPYPFAELDPQTGLLTNLGLYRESEDLVLTNVLAFDVKIWDPAAPVVQVGDRAVRPGDIGYKNNPNNPVNPVSRGAYVDLAYLPVPYTEPNTPALSVFSNAPSFYYRDVYRERPGVPTLAVYDTWSIHYEKDGIDQDGIGGPDTGSDGFDNNNDGRVDEIGEWVDDIDEWIGEWEAPPPYAAPCRGIKVTIRVFEPDSRQIRQVTVVQDFLPK